MVMICLFLLVGAGVFTMLRTLAIGPLAGKLTPIGIWRYDFGLRYGWLAGGAVLLFILLNKGARLDESMLVMASWATGLVAIWLLPSLLLDLFDR